MKENWYQHEWIEGGVQINLDHITQEVFGDWNSPEAVLKALNLAKTLREDCLKKRGSLLFETVLPASDKIDFIRRAKSVGYFIRLFFVGTDSPAINASRVARRVMESGHDVPISKIITRYTKKLFYCCENRG